MRILDEIVNHSSEDTTHIHKIGISGHIHPDGDCVGSCLAMQLFLKKALPDAQVDVYLEMPSEIFACIEGYSDISHALFTKEEEYDEFIVLDSVPERIGFAQKLYEKAKKKINIDHHISNMGGSDADYIVPTASSASELVYDVIDKELMDKDIALAIYIGIIHDTGVMQYSNTSPKTLRIVADLLEYDFPFPEIIDETFYEKTFVQNQLLGEVLLQSELLLHGKIIASKATLELLDAYSADKKDLDGIVNQLRFTKGVELAIFMYEIEPGTYKISLRSSAAIDASVIAQAFEGGGHKRAAGCTITGTYEAICEMILKEVEKQLN